jgi:hypothetical protein
MFIENMPKGHFVFRCFVPPDVLSPERFVPLDILSRSRLLVPRTFCLRTLCLRMFCPSGHFRLRTFCLGTGYTAIQWQNWRRKPISKLAWPCDTNSDVQCPCSVSMSKSTSVFSHSFSFLCSFPLLGSILCWCLCSCIFYYWCRCTLKLKICK